MLQIGTEEAWLWVAVESIQFTNKSLECISRYRNMIVTESFMRSLIKIYGGKHIVYSDGETWYCIQKHACISLGLEQRLHSPSYEKSIGVERRTIEYLKRQN